MLSNINNYTTIVSPYLKKHFPCLALPLTIITPPCHAVPAVILAILTPSVITCVESERTDSPNVAVGGEFLEVDGGGECVNRNS